MKMNVSENYGLVYSTLLTIGLLFSHSAHAQLEELNVPGGTNVTISSSESYSQILVGRDEADNQLNIVSGGNVDVATLVEIGQQVDATNSQLNVSGGGLLVIGNASTNNLPLNGIVVSDSAGNGELKVGYDSKVTTDDLYVGVGSNETGKVTAKNGGEIVIEGDIVIGSADNEKNLVSIEDGSSLLISETSNLQVNNKDGATENLNQLNIKTGGSLLIKGDVDTADLKSNDGINLETGSTLGIGGTLTTTDNAIQDGLNLLLDNELSTNNQAQFHTDFLNIGADDSDNALIIKNGALFTSTNAVTIGRDDTALRNSLVVDGSNSTFTALKSVYVGANGSNNNLDILDGAEADISGDLIIGASIASGNEVTVSGTGSVLKVANQIYVGRNGKSSTLNIDDAATAVFQSDLYLGTKSANNRYNNDGGTNTIAGNFIIGQEESSGGKTGSATATTVQTSGNLATVEGDALTDIGQDLTIGQKGTGSILLIRDGGVVNVAGNAVIGEEAADNYIYLQRGTNTRFNVAGDLTVGNSSEGSNRFAVYGGTATIDGDLYLGTSTNQHEAKNFIHLETTNAVLNVAHSVYIGASNSVNTLDLENGASASMQDLFVGIYEGTSNNVVTVSGDNSLLAVSNTLVIGSASGTNNAVNVTNGGTLEVAQENITIGSTNDYLTVADGGILKTLGWDFGAQTNLSTNIVFNSGSTLHMLGSLSGTNKVEGGLNFILNGAGSSWGTGTNNLYVGHETGNNSLTITNGATASTMTNLYIGYESSGNAVTVAGAGSSLTVGENLQLGAEVDSWQRNELNVLEGALVSIGNDAYIYRGSTLKIDADSQVTVGGNFVQDEYSALEIGVSSNQATSGHINLVVEGDAKFTSSYDPDNHKLIKIYDDGIGESNIVTIVKAGSIYLDDEIAKESELSGHIATNSLLGFTATLTTSNGNTYIVLDDFIKRSIGEGLDGQLLAVSQEIELLALDSTNTNATQMLKVFADMNKEEHAAALDALYGEKMSSIPAHNVINMGIQSVANQLTMRADSTRSRMGAASAAVNFDKPEGAEGPHEAGQELQGWINAYGTWGSQDAADGFSGYDADLSGFMVGADFSVAENVLIGIAGGKGNGSISKETGSNTDTKSVHAALYGSMGTKDWFFDTSLIYGTSDVDTRMGSTFDTTSDYSARNIAFYVGGGKEIKTDYFIFTPQLSMLANSYDQDGYTEKASNAVEREIDSFDAFYLQSSLGCSMGMYMGSEDFTFKPEIRAHWLHEWMGDDETVNYNLIGGTGTYQLALQAPEKDILKIGVGSAFKFGEYLELRADFDTRQSGSYSDYTLLGSLRYQF